MVALMFYYNQRCIQVLECIFMCFRTEAEQYPTHTVQKELYGSHAVQYVLCYGIDMFDSHVTPRKPKAISHGQILDCCSELNYLPYIPTICKVAYPNHLNRNLPATQLSDSLHTKQRPLGMTAAIHYSYYT